MKHALFLLLLVTPMAPAQEEPNDTGIRCNEDACTMNRHVFAALLQAATRGPVPCYQRS